MPLTLTAAPDDDERRLDRILRKALPQLPLSALHRLFRKGKITVDGKAASPDTRVKQGQVIEIRNEEGRIKNEKLGMKSDNSSFFTSHSSFFNMILYEGSGLLVINKPCGLAVHGPNSLNDEVLRYLEPKLPPSLSFKPGPLHRLDKPSSGLVVFSTNLASARTFSAMMRQGKIQKQYLAIVDGILDRDEYWQDELTRDHARQKTIGTKVPGTAKPAATRVKVLATAPNHSLLLAEIETGRTHQIRSQAALHGHPLSGDNKYGGKPFARERGFYLHAWKLRFTDNSLAPAPHEFTAPLPKEFANKVNELFGNNISISP